MASEKEVQLRKVFPDAKEKIMADYKCSLYLDFHHPGHMYITQNNLYFYSVKNIIPPLPNPLAVNATFKELKEIEKTGIDGILISTKDEEILLDSFQFRNETFDALQRNLLKARGENYVAQSEKKEYQPVDVEVKRLMTRSLDGLPFFNDLGMFSLHYTISEEDKPIFVGPDTKEMTKTQRFKHLIFTLNSALVKNWTDRAEIEKKFDEFFAHAEEDKVKYSLEPPTPIQFLRENFGENSALVMCLKACIHPITTAVIRIKEYLTSFYPTKDLSWDVKVNIHEDTVEVNHLRYEQSIKGLFFVEWKMGMIFDKTVTDLKDVKLNVTDLLFHEDTKEASRYEIQKLLKDLLPPAQFGGKNSVLLPSFVDLSDQKLVEIPREVFNMKKLQTLYLHMNEIETIPDDIFNLDQLQVLYLNQNKLAEIPPAILKMKNLRELHVGRNRISAIPEEIGEMENLRELSLSYNLLTQIPPQIFNLKNLKKLYLHNNYLETVPRELSQLPNLKTLQIHNNQKMKGPMANFGPGDSEEIIKFLKDSKI
eukprot:TRINITY_DN2546_c3_g1_i1.p1 TRINITY_DN2546_c3_g1~~TRINITY_DN2546_c3_g1_i1.p1  ORF type:complete len:537 (+),score=230.06 TRINITY_DN2546_c3_g1_i1:59-1669(+)